MARPARIEYEGAFYHVMNRGNGRESIFIDNTEIGVNIDQKEPPWNNLKGQIFLGDEGFIECLKDYLAKKEAINEIPRIQRLVGRPALKSLFGTKTLSKIERNRKIYLAHIKSAIP